MKRALLLFIATGFMASAMAQVKPLLNHPKNNVKAPIITAKVDGQVIGLQSPNTIVASDATLADEITMTSLYDLQTNSTMQQRLFRYDDGTMAAVATMSHQNDYQDRGTGYNYFDGTAWGTQPATRIEGIRTGWPSYAPLGANGEIVCAHASGTAPLYLNRRTTRGTGTWTQTELAAPTDAAGLLWPRMVTSGPDHMTVHIFALTSPTGNGGVVWNDLDGALVYNRSLDGGDNWDGWILMDGMTSTEYLGFGGDTYAWAQPVGNTLAFVVGDGWYDQFIMKSEDNGDTWTKTIIWDCPYDLWVGADTTGDFYQPDGSSAVAIGPDGKVHVLFGLLEGYGGLGPDEKYYYPWRDGLIYWNEDMPYLGEVLDPDVLYANGNYIGWVQDTNVWYMAETQLATYWASFSSMPSIVVDDANQVFAIWSGMTTYLDADSYMYRHLFARASVNGGTTWRDAIVDITGELIQQWTEFVYPTVASKTTQDKIYLLDQDDDLAGVFLKSTNSGYQGQMDITTNNITLMAIDKNEIIMWPVGVDKKSENTFTVSQNYPNPATDRSTVSVRLTQPGTLSLALINVVGQQVMNLEKGFVNSGSQQFTLNTSELPAGIYFYTVTLNDQSITKRMIVE